MFNGNPKSLSDNLLAWTIIVKFDSIERLGSID